MDELNALPFLDAVVRETLRIHPPVPASSDGGSDDTQRRQSVNTLRNGEKPIITLRTPKLKVPDGRLDSQPR